MVDDKSDGAVTDRVPVPASRGAALYLNVAFITPMFFAILPASLTGAVVRFGCALLVSVLLLTHSRRFLGVVVEPTGFTARDALRPVFVRWTDVEGVRPSWFRMIRVNTTVGVFFIPASIAQDSDAMAIIAKLDCDHPLRRALAARLQPSGP